MDNTLALLQEQSEDTCPEAPARLFGHMCTHILCPSRHTITNLITTAGQQDKDWSANYRLYSSMKPTSLFRPVLSGILEWLPPTAPLVVFVDDSMFKKTGKSIPTTGWYRDSLSPPFHTNLTWGQRFVQLSAALIDPDNPAQARVIPIAYAGIQKLAKPQKDASEEDLRKYALRKAANTPGAITSRLLRELRSFLAAKDDQRHIFLGGDGDYTNSTLLQNLPINTVYFGRSRGDLDIQAVPDNPKTKGRGRPRSYGYKLPTPEELQKDKSVPWTEMTMFKRGVSIPIRYKLIEKCKWDKAGEKAIVKIVVIDRFRYKLRKDGRWLYTKPTYLLCNDVKLSAELIIQMYLWRWDIEVNFKEEKQLFGAGQAQVRNPNSVDAVPTMCIATYACLLLAGMQTYGFDKVPPSLSSPKWYPRKKKSRVTSSDLIDQFKHECAARSLRFANFSDFVTPTGIHPTSEKFVPAPASGTQRKIS